MTKRKTALRLPYERPTGTNGTAYKAIVNGDVDVNAAVVSDRSKGLMDVNSIDSSHVINEESQYNAVEQATVRSVQNAGQSDGSLLVEEKIRFQLDILQCLGEAALHRIDLIEDRINGMINFSQYARETVG